MWTDPIVEEIHQTRQKLMEAAGGDLHEVIRRANAHRDPARRIIVGQPRRPKGWAVPRTSVGAETSTHTRPV